MQLTTNYKLRKPDGTDNVDINDFNYNADIIDNTIKTHTHTKSQITDMPTSLKNPNALTIQLNGSSQGAYDGSSAKTINVTKSSIGLSNVDNVSKAQILASPALTGVPTAPTATAGTNTTQIATTAFVTTAVNNKTSVSGNAGTATKLQTARTINGVAFDGSQNITTPSISTGGNITLHADSDSSTTTEYASIKAGGNELKITSSGGGSSPAKNNNNLTFNGNVVYHAGKKPTPADIGASATGHTHDDRYYTESEINTKLNGKANSSHNHDIITGGNANRFDLTAPNDCCGLSKQNNVDIKSWYGVSISNACGGAGVQGRPTVSFDARTGNAWFEGDIYVKGQSTGLFQSVSNGKSAIANAITGKGVSASSSDSFDTLASKIKQISTGTDTSSANATASDIALGKTAYVKGSKITGTNRLIKGDSGSVVISSSDASKYGITYSRQNVNLQSDTSSYQKAYAYVFNIPVSNFNLNGANFMIEFNCSITNENTYSPYYNCKTIMCRNGLGALAGYYSNYSSTSGAIYVSSSTVKGQNIGVNGATVNVPFYIGGGSVSNFYYTLSWNYYGTK